MRGLELVEGSIEHQPPVVDEQHPLAQPRDFRHVVRGQHDRATSLLDLRAQELPGLFLDHDVHADRRLVEKHDRRVVQHGAGDLATHPLAKREVPHRRVPEFRELKDLVEVGELTVIDRLRHVEDVAQDRERLLDREVPPQLRFLAKNCADVAGVRDSVSVRHPAVDENLAG